MARMKVDKAIALMRCGQAFVRKYHAAYGWPHETAREPASFERRALIDLHKEFCKKVKAAEKSGVRVCSGARNAQRTNVLVSPAISCAPE